MKKTASLTLKRISAIYKYTFTTITKNQKITLLACRGTKYLNKRVHCVVHYKTT